MSKNVKKKTKKKQVAKIAQKLKASPKPVKALTPRTLEKHSEQLVTKGSGSYGAKDIFVLEGLEPVRKRPGMYIGSTGPAGLHHLLWEIVDNGLDEAMAGFAKHIEITLLAGNRARISDDGRGIPVEKHPQTKKSTLETVLTTLHAGGKFGGSAYKVSGGLHGVGASVVNALSTHLKAEVCRDGALWAQEFSRGKPTTKVERKGPCKKNGTTMTFEADRSVFPDAGDFDWKTIIDHLREQAYLTRGVHISVYDEREGRPKDAKVSGVLGENVFGTQHSFYFEGGVVSYVKYLTRHEISRHQNIFYVEKDSEDIHVEVAFRYTQSLLGYEYGFANNIHTPEGGMHVTGFRTALTRTLNDYARKQGFVKEQDDNLTGEDVHEGLTVIISVKLREPQFEGQTKSKLGNPEARTAVDAVVADAITTYLEQHPQDARAIIEQCVISQKARKAAKAARDTVLRKGIMEGLALPGKLADCQSRDPEESELYIVEGDSAGGSAKQARDRRFQAILPLRGKILNVERARLDRMLTSEQIRNLVIAMGTAVAEEFDLTKLRYHRIILMTDADIDGAHIRTLLLTLFWRYFRPIIEAGYLYIAEPPLYRIQSGKQVSYAFSDREKDEAVKSLKAVKEEKKKTKGDILTIKKQGKITGEIELGEGAAVSGEVLAKDGEEAVKTGGPAIQRYKGLGEMNPEQLWETTMNPQNRIMHQVAFEDAKKADEVFETLMGDDVAPRKRFISTHATKVKNLDV
ncbi:MAG: DNA topoisomerase (ATP-hydrolyzing) subunit B [bacterium]|nr:DNA topoisomerase (ATP-hydrolyzing) subunit B [bacterium]